MRIPRYKSTDKTSTVSQKTKKLIYSLLIMRHLNFKLFSFIIIIRNNIIIIKVLFIKLYFLSIIFSLTNILKYS